MQFFAGGFFMSRTPSSLRTKILVESSLCIALVLILSHIKLFRMPQGGSVTLEMLPLLFLSFRWGVKWGALSGILAGILQIAFGGFFLHPLQVLLDYPIALGAVGLSGLWKNHPVFSSLLAGGSRLFCHVLSGVIFFSAYAPPSENIWLYSFLYNITFLLPSLILSLFLAWILAPKLNKK